MVRAPAARMLNTLTDRSNDELGRMDAFETVHLLPGNLLYYARMHIENRRNPNQLPESEKSFPVDA